MAKRCLNQVQGRTVVKSVRCMGVTEPVSTDTDGRPSSNPRLFDNAENAGAFKVLS